MDSKFQVDPQVDTSALGNYKKHPGKNVLKSPVRIDETLEQTINKLVSGKKQI
jgi:hypothetical protein